LQDIPYLYHDVLRRTGIGQKMAIEDLAEAILTLPKEAAILETRVFASALAVARPRCEALARRYRRVSWFSRFGD
jgi:hypothetical protein